MHSSAGQDEWEMMQKDQALVREAEKSFLETRNTTTLQEAYKDLLQRHSPGNRSAFVSEYTTSANAWLLAMVRLGRIQELKGNVTAAHQFYKSAALNGSRDGYFRLALLIFSRQEAGRTSSSDSGSSSGNTDEIESTAKFYARCAAAAGHGLARHLVGYKQLSEPPWYLPPPKQQAHSSVQSSASDSVTNGYLTRQVVNAGDKDEQRGGSIAFGGFLSEIDVEDEVSSNGSGGGFGIDARPETQVTGRPQAKPVLQVLLQNKTGKGENMQAGRQPL
jgi:TPR repeat protein